MLTEKLDAETRRHWELASPGKEYPKLSELKAYLEQRCRALEATGGTTKPKHKHVTPMQTSTHIKSKPSQFTTSHHAATNNSPEGCPVCKGEHLIYKCDEFGRLNDHEKTTVVRKHSLCFNCLRSNHTSQQCRSDSKCRKCGNRHHTLLHYTKPTSSKQQAPPDVTTTVLLNHFSDNNPIKGVLLSTAIVKITDNTGSQQQCKVILDSGSQASFITEACIARLGLVRSKASVSVVGIGQTGSSIVRGQVQLELKSFRSDFTLHMNALIMSKLTSYVPGKHIENRPWAHLVNLKLADPSFGNPGEIDMILGADVFGELLLDGRITGNDHLPSAFNTQFGWVLTGRTGNCSQQTVTVNHAHIEVSEQLKQFWELEECVNKKHLSPEEEACEAHFTEHYTRCPDGRYQVRLPLIDSSALLGSSKTMAIKRMLQVERRLNHDPEQKEQYIQFMRQYAELGHMIPIPSSEREEFLQKTNYLPHHFVCKESSSSTKLRVVFDASAKTTTGVSLNDKLMVGPKLQDDIWDILLRFRMHKVAFTADVVKMYRQIRMNKEDSDLQRIVWRQTTTEPFEEYQLCTVTYGTASAPYLAVKVLQQVAHDHGVQYPLAKEIVLKDFYVDDVISGTDSITTALESQSQLLDMLAMAGFHLRKWSSNEASLLEAVPEEYRETNLPLGISSGDATKALGLHWNTTEDYLFFRVQLAIHKEDCSKRTILSEVASLYDPLGLLAPVTIVAKNLIQRMWVAGLSWDEEVPLTLRQDWLRFRRQMPKLENIQIPRCVKQRDQVTGQLHGFCDASELAYGAVVYLRTTNQANQVSVHLICSKTKVAPLKQVSIPRLELCGAVLLARLLAKVMGALSIHHDSIHAWTDSMVTLGWIAGLPRNWKTFVANRVSEIQTLVPPKAWKHVPTLDNPADAASRGINPGELNHHTIWWQGPSWLKLNHPEWPKTPSGNASELETTMESKGITTLSATFTTSWELIMQVSSLTKLCRVTAYCCRFLKNARTAREKRKVGCLSTCELQNAMTVCIKFAQCEGLGQTHEDLVIKRVTSSKLHSLSPFVDEQGVIRVGGRLRYSKCSYDQRFPVLLPTKHKLTELVITHTHIKQLHAGPQATLSAIQQRYWIVNGRNSVRLNLHKCHTCFRDRANTQHQMMGDLPSHRVEHARPFIRVGVDYGGPFSIKTRKGRGGQTTKAYVALFICLATKAVHLELVSELTSDAFIATLKRFISRRGRCLDIYSDNGTNFVGSNKMLKEFHRQFKGQPNQNAIIDYLASGGTTWHFLPARAPHFGGLWEAGIKSTKTHLRRVIGQTTLTFEELLTVLAQIEACLNSRPLYPMSTDPNDLTCLTPAHFLIGDTFTSWPEPNLLELKINRLSRWQLTQRLYQHFWNRWHKEYLGQLQQRSKWTSKQVNIKCGDLVLIKEDHIPPLHWVKGRIVETYPGKDNLVRVASVKTSSGVFKRPIVKLCVLPTP